MNNHDELRQRHKPSHFFEALCMVEHEPWPCSTVKLLDENERLRKAVTWALEKNKERHGSGHNACSHVSCVLRRALGDAS